MSSDVSRVETEMDFYVTMNVTVHAINLMRQTAAVEIQSKWFWKDEQFIEKLCDATSGVDILIDMDAVALPSSIEKLSLFQLKQSVISRLEERERVLGCSIKGDVRAFPVNTEKILSNGIGKCEFVAPAWVQYGKYGNYGEDVVVVQLEFRTEVYIDPCLEAFPLNKVGIILKPNVRKSVVKRGAISETISWRFRNFYELFAEGTKCRYPEEVNAVNIRASPAVPNLSFRKPFVRKGLDENRRLKVTFVIGAETGKSIFFFAMVCPIFVVVLAALSAMRTSKVNENLRSMGTILGGIVGYRTYVQSHLPQLTKPTPADYFMFTSASFVTIIILTLMCFTSVNETDDTFKKHANDWYTAAWVLHFGFWVLILTLGWPFLNLEEHKWMKAFVKQPRERARTFPPYENAMLKFEEEQCEDGCSASECLANVVATFRNVINYIHNPRLRRRGNEGVVLLSRP
mmetsp:Transcript_22373/g.70077  ORF Transcript_22373/g.70077 Transcript_22373/m.70077 type:complete len:458 (-) Transcript_22373:119-1492(-)